MESIQMPTTNFCPNCKQPLDLLVTQSQTNAPCPACGKWFNSASTPSNVPPLHHQTETANSFSPNESVGGTSTKPNVPFTGSTRFLFGICAVAGLLIAGVIGFFMLQDAEHTKNSRTTAEAPIADPLAPNSSGSLESKKDPSR